MASDYTLWSASTPTVDKGNARKLHALGGAFTIATGSLALNKTTSLFKVPKGFVAVSIKGYITDCDSNGSAALVFDIGDADDPNRLVAGSTAGQAGGALTEATATVIGVEYTAETEIVMTTTTAAATAAAGTLTFYIYGYFL